MGADRGARHNGGRSSFSLLELLLVVLLIGVIAAIGAPRILASQEEARRAANERNIANINLQVERYYQETGTWPKDKLDHIKNDPTYFPDGLPVCPVCGLPYQLDSLTKRVKGHDH
jgi:general secretion pathway protein G